jgi:hypothetical protein
MMAITNFSVNKLRWWAVIDDVDIELTRVEVHYALNSIPTAILQCAIGREVRSLMAAAIHFIINELKINVPVQVFCQATEVTNSGIPGMVYPDGPFVVFDGRIVGTSFQKSMTGGANLILYCRHFLMDLEYAVTNTRTTHPINLNAFNMEAGIRMGPGEPDFVVGTIANKYFTKTNVEKDFWGAALRPWLEEVIDQPVVFENEEIGSNQGADNALAALARIEPPYQFGVPLTMRPFAALNVEAAIDAMAQNAAWGTFQSFYGQSIWEKIVAEFASQYLFAVVPMAERALVVPFIPGLNSTWTVIDPTQYEVISLNSDLPRGLFGVIVYTGTNSMTGAVPFQEGQGGAITTVGGRFENDNMDAGMMIFRDGPQWLCNAVSELVWARGAAAPNAVRGNMMFPGAGAGPPGPFPAEIRDEAKEMWDAYARSIYLYEVLKNRRGSIQGAVRFDISPGSSIELITAEEKFIGGQTGVGDMPLYAMVTKVSTVYDSDSVKGQTTIEFGFIHDEIEHDDPALSTDSHPLWSEVWVGAPLVEEFGAAEPPPDV